jgi:predicted nucleic acid-binding protein
MNSIVVADAGPLIALARINYLNIIHNMYGNILIPTAVFKELAIETNKPGVVILKTAISDGWLKVVETEFSLKEKSVLRLLLDKGETEAILLAELVNCRFLLIDERKGRAVAKQRGIPIVGICGLLLLAKEKGFISKVVLPLNNLLNIGYRISPKLISQVLDRAKE